MEEQIKQPFNRKFKLVLGICLLVSLIFGITHFNFQVYLQSLLIWVKSLGIFGPIAFIAIYNLATVLFVPGSILTIGGGVLFGVVWGSIYVFVAAILGAILAFMIGRYLLRGWVAKQIEANAKFKAIDQAVGQEGWKIVLLTRLSPVFPFNFLNYAFGVTQVSLKDYILGSFGIIPGTVLYVYIGSLAGDLAMMGMENQQTNPETQIAKWVIRVVGLIATVAVTVYITRVANKSLEESVVNSSNLPGNNSES
ncbi:MAG: TVP38/TMEM64 family protein [Potamolinea sp.]